MLQRLSHFELKWRVSLKGKRRRPRRRCRCRCLSFDDALDCCLSLTAGHKCKLKYWYFIFFYNGTEDIYCAVNAVTKIIPSAWRSLLDCDLKIGKHANIHTHKYTHVYTYVHWNFHSHVCLYVYTVKALLADSCNPYFLLWGTSVRQEFEIVRLKVRSLCIYIYLWPYNYLIVKPI